jgi:hypothetical protein
MATEKTPDMVNHPSHYADKKIEVIDYIRDTLTSTGFTDYCGGNVLKYVSRWRKKGGIEDLKKAQVYLGWMIEGAEKEIDTDVSNLIISNGKCVACGKDLRGSRLFLCDDCQSKQLEESSYEQKVVQET